MLPLNGRVEIMRHVNLRILRVACIQVAQMTIRLCKCHPLDRP